MSFASGFFNSVDHDRLYDATDISRLFDGLIRDGIFASIGDCLVVKQSNQMNVTVGTGRAWFNHTWSYNDALYPVTIPPSEILMDRIDAIVLEINSVEAVRANSIKLIKGTPASTPTKPALTNTKEVHQYPLAYVTVGKEVTSIRQADIENCVGTSVCPFVTGILEVISIEQLIPQWKDILNRFVEENTANFNTWMNGEKQEYQDWLTAAKKDITDWEATSKSDYQKWYDSIKNGYDQWFATIKAAYDANWSTFQQWEKSSQDEFDQWFENMKNKLEGDLGAKLTLETEKLGKEKVSLIESTKTDLTGTVEAPLMIGNATRNLLNPSLLSIRPNDLKDSGITATVNSDGSITLNGTSTRSIWSLLYTTHGSGNNNMFKGLRVFTNAKNYQDVRNTLYIAYCKDNDGTKETWVSTKNGDLIPDGNGDPCLIRMHIPSGVTLDNETFFIMLTDDDEGATNDELIPYSGYDIKTYGKNLLAYPYAQKTANNNGLTFTVLKEGTIKIEGTTEKSFLAFIISTDECNAFLLRMLKAGHDLKISAKKSVTNVESYLQVFTNTNVYVKNFSDILKHDAYDWSKHHVIIAIQHNNPASNVNATVSDIMVTLDDSDTTAFTAYQFSTTKITQATEFPNFDLKSFDGATHIISPGNVQSFHADAPNGKYLLESIKKSAESGGISYGSDKPTNSKPGDLWIDTSRSNVLQYYTGKYWYPVNSGIYIASTGGFPSSPYVGQLCYNPTTKMMYVYIPYGGQFGGPGWYPIGSEDPGGYHYGASAPANTKLLWIDTSGVARFYNGSSWVPLAATWG